MNLKTISEPVSKELEEFDKLFSSSLKSNVALIDLITKYILKKKGKKVRPLLVLLSAKACGGVTERTYIAATMVELLHTATLIHDDVVDEAKTRRGIPSINVVWKNKAAVLMGDFLLSKGLLVSLDNSEFDFLKVTSEAVRRMSEGELLQIQKARNFDASEETYFKVISDKTASLIQTCCKLGAISASGDKAKTEMMAVYGENAGIAFQIRDDILDYAGRKNLLGKATGNDLKEKKFTLPLIVSLRNSPKKKAAEIMKLIKSDSKKKFAAVSDYVTEYGGIEYANKKAELHSTLAINAISALENSDSKESLIRFADFVVNREA